eukprot:1142990-Pelagomonas_calceolata.AAC.1
MISFLCPRGGMHGVSRPGCASSWHSARLHSPKLTSQLGGSRSPQNTSALVIGLQNVPQQSLSGQIF